MSTVPWLADNSVTVGGVTYSAGSIEGAKLGTDSGALVNGGLCSSTGAWSGKVVLCERGSISFFDKVRNVQNSGGAAAVIYNNAPGNFAGTLGDGNTSTIPAVSLSQEDGQYLVANKLGASATVKSTLDKTASGYESWDGTSMATPHVSGVAALVWSANPSWTVGQIRDALQKSALDLGAAGRDNSYGFGLVQAKSAWEFLGGGSTPPPPTPTPTEPPASSKLNVTVETDFTSYVNGNTAIITVRVTDSAGPVSGATVYLTITTANKKTASGSATTLSDGTARFNYKINSKTGGTGTYYVDARATKSGYEEGKAITINFEVVK
jgi:serine protease